MLLVIRDESILGTGLDVIVVLFLSGPDHSLDGGRSFVQLVIGTASLLQRTLLQ